MDFLFLNSKAHLLLMRSSAEVSGGAELQVALLGAELAGRGASVGIIHGSEGPASSRVVGGVECIPGGPFHTGDLADVFKALVPVFRAIGRRQPRNVLVLGWTAWLFLLWVMRPLFRYRLVFICGLDPEADGSFAAKNGLRGRLFDFAMRRCDVRFAMSDTQATLFEKRGMSCSLYRNLVLWPETERLEAKDIDLLWIARCRQIKRPLLFAELARRLPGARCVMVCPPEDKSLFKDLADEVAGIPNLELIEFVPYHQVQQYYNRCLVFVNTSTAEGFANSFIQAGLGGAAILSLSVDCDGVLQRFGAGICADNHFERMVAGAEELLQPGGKRLSRCAEGAETFVRTNHGTVANVNAFLDGLGEGHYARLD